MSTLLEKIKSALLCMSAHPDNEQGSEFEDRIEDLIEIETFLKTIPQWVKIKSEDDLPKQGGSYHIVIDGKVSKGSYLKNNRWLVPSNDYPKTTENHGITHYQKISIPDLPLT